jgi:small subunit ribosomal protein S9
VADTATKKKVYYLGTGRRKTAVARVRIAEGTGKIAINKRPLEGFFTEDKDRNSVLGPLLLTEMRNRLDVFVRVHGGGYSGQAGAICQGLARALKGMFGELPGEPAPAAAPPAEGEAAKPAEPTESLFSKKLRDSGFLTRDGRMKERKKYGRKGARKSFQFSKR